MAVEMVRKPSETPNIENIDDFMPIRYAYANQNGYVIGDGAIGTGIDAEAYTINGNTFTIHSGRLVLQGVECDIKNDHPVVIDINSTKRYCAIYLEVNLETNTSDIFVAYDMLGTPSVDVGDNLTTNKVGTARMVLFTCEATNGLISNVVKVVKACEYSIPFRVDENDVLRYNNFIVPYEIEIFNGELSSTLTEEDNDIIVDLLEDRLKDNEIYRIAGKLNRTYFETYITKLHTSISDTVSNSYANAGFNIIYPVEISDSITSSVSTLNVVVIATTNKIRFHTFFNADNTRPLRSGFVATINKITRVVR